MTDTDSAYSPGLHIICEFQCGSAASLNDESIFRNAINGMIAQHGLQKVGEVYYKFPGAGYTAVICLTESHISIHTWPEYGRVTFDVFLSNYKKVNDGIARAIADGVIGIFSGTDVKRTELKR